MLDCTAIRSNKIYLSTVKIISALYGAKVLIFWEY